MKKGLILILIISLLTSLVGCSGAKYEPVPSTEEESTVVMTLKYGQDSYDVKYELYRAMFLTYKDEISRGDDSVWNGADKDEYIEEINELIIDRISEIYSVFAICKKIGFDLFSREVDREIERYITESVEGGSGAIGYGSYEKYLEALADKNLNYSVQDLLYRYAIGLEAIDEHYIGTFDADDITNTIIFGNIKYTKDDVREFYFSDDCVRMLRAYVQYNAHFEPMQYAKTVRDRMIEAAESGESAVATVIINTGLTAATEVQRGYVIGEYSMDALYYSELTEAAFDLEIGEVSEPVTVHNGDEKIIFIVYCAEKNTENFEDLYSEIAYVYLTNEVGRIMDEASDVLSDNVSFSDAFRGLDYSSIRMNNETAQN